tara:strand:+ start:301 stop:453 length:153 start_codon:yes stop_codon:yes gene_type:complete
MDTCEIEEGERGQFDVFRSGELIFSKERAGRFPTEQDIAFAIEVDDILTK